MSEKLVCGVDFGTTNSLMGRIDPSTGRPDFFQDERGQIIIPTALYYKDGEKPIIGDKARRMAQVRPDQVADGFKPLLDDPSLKIAVDGDRRPPEKIIKDFFKYGKDQVMSKNNHQPITAVVITVPAYLGSLGRERIKTGAESAGLKVKELVSEPVAASSAYRYEAEKEIGEKILVYDCGGGTFDTAVVDLEDKKVLRNSGDLHLGGNDFTQAILNNWKRQYHDRHGADPFTQPEIKRDWWLRAEKAKVDLSSEEEIEERLTCDDGPSMLVSLTREEFESAIDPQVSKTLDIVQRVLNEEKVSTKNIDWVVLVGGSTRIPYVRQRVSQFFNQEVNPLIDPIKAVAIGAMLTAADIEGTFARTSQGELYLESAFEDVTAHGLGIKVINKKTGREENSVLIKKGASLPAKGSAHFKPIADDSPLVKVTIVEGDSEELNQCKVLQEGYTLPINNPRRADLVDIEGTLIINTNGLVEVEAKTDDGARIHEKFKHPKILGKGG